MVTPSPPIKHLQHQHPPPRPPRPLNIFWFRSCTYRCSRLTLPIYCDGFVFTGNFDCAILINNYLPKEEVMCFTKPGYTENESKLSTALAKLVYKFIMMVLIINDNDIVLLWIKCNRSIIIFFRLISIQWKWFLKYLLNFYLMITHWKFSTYCICWAGENLKSITIQKKCCVSNFIIWLLFCLKFPT